MKLKFVITSMFSIALLVGIASAQGGVLYVGTDHGVYVPLTPVSATSGPVKEPNLSSFAGQTIRIQFSSTTDIADPIYVLMGTPPLFGGCNPENLFSRPTSGTSAAIAGIVIAATSDNNRVSQYEVPTDLAWKGTCRVVSVKRRDGSEHIGRVFFK